jgi:hypothetical protein
MPPLSCDRLELPLPSTYAAGAAVFDGNARRSNDLDLAG